MPWFVYILFCDEKTYYVGLSSNPTSRFISHVNKQNIATKEFSRLDRVYLEKFATRTEAAKRETQLKGWTVAKKKSLIDGNTEFLKKLSKSHERVETRAG